MDINLQKRLEVCMTMSQIQIWFIQAMLEDHTEYQIRKETMKWYHLNHRQGFNSVYFKGLHKILCDVTQAQVTFDTRFADAIVFCINFMLCTMFEDQDRHSLNLSIFIRMAEQLYEKGLIGKRHLHEIKTIKCYNIIHKINQYMNRVSVGKFSWEEMEQQWQEMVGVSLFQFWKAVMHKKVKQTILVTLYDFIKQIPSITKSNQIKEYVQLLRKEHKQYKQQKQQQLNSTKDNETENNVIDELDQRLKQVAYYYSMFNNPAHKTNLTNINHLLSFVHNNIFVNEEYRLQLFGSLKSTFALSNWYDIDLNYLSLRQKNIDRQVAIDHLKRIQSEFRNKPISWYKKSYIHLFAIPVLKVETDPIQFSRCFGIENIDKLDFTVGNRPAVINSVFLSNYSKIPQIHFFCILVKIWAKSRDVINKTVPYNGLSSYVVILMCLYYLMETGQIDYIDISQQELNNIDVGTFTPNLKRVRLKSLYQNFKGFLQFYSETGKFQKQRKIVCLLKSQVPQHFVWDQNLIVNVYDFIDKSNPGRLTMQHRDFQFMQFRRALQLLKCRTIPKINQIFQNN